MIAEEAARERILATARPLGEELVPLRECGGCFASRNLFAERPLPLFDNSSMDGYALRAADGATGARLKIAGEQAAGGVSDTAVGPGEAVRIFTGAPLPAGADAVIMQEDVTAMGDGWISVTESVVVGENIRRTGADLAAGQKILHAGEPITPQLAALLASQGMAQIAVGRRPTVAILSTGDELLKPGQPLAPGKIHESNSVMLEMLAVAAGARVTAVETVADDRDALSGKLRELLKYDALIIWGGVSVGERDFVKAELQRLAVDLHLWRVAIKPGKPFAFGTLENCRVFGLPGNPVSSFVTFLCFVRPALLRMAGAAELGLARQTVLAEAELRNTGDRPHYVRGRVMDGRFAICGRQEAHALFGLSQSNALVRLGAGETIATGAQVEALGWGG